MPFLDHFLILFSVSGILTIIWNTILLFVWTGAVSKPRIEVIDRTVAAILAAKTPAERIALANSAHRFACRMLKSRIKQTSSRLVGRNATPRISTETTWRWSKAIS